MKYLMLMLLLAVPFAAAGAVKGDLLGAAMEQVRCKADFTTGVLDSIDSNAPGASLDAYSGKIKSDTAQLQSYADSNDTESFRTFLRGTFDPDLRMTREAVRSWRIEGGKNLTLKTRAALRTSFDALKTDFESCHFGAMKDFADAKVNGYTQFLSLEAERASNLSSKGISTSRLNSLIQDAESQIVAPLQSAIGSSSDGRTLSDALRKYCLFDGCPNGTNFHFAAKWEIAKLTAIEEFVKTQPKAGNYTAELGKVTSDLDAADSALASIGPSQYGSQENTVWAPIRDAAQTLKTVIHGMRS
ncbi:MAG: hypothetical protein U0R44_02600 [Candidatus Micrarchaeia archaeon]